MSSEVAQIIIATATLMSSIAGLVMAFRGSVVADKTHALVNGQSEQLNALREAKGHAEGMIAGRDEASLEATRVAYERSEPPIRISPANTGGTGGRAPGAS